MCGLKLKLYNEQNLNLNNYLNVSNIFQFYIYVACIMIKINRIQVLFKYGIKYFNDVNIAYKINKEIHCNEKYEIL